MSATRSMKLSLSRLKAAHTLLSQARQEVVARDMRTTCALRGLMLADLQAIAMNIAELNRRLNLVEHEEALRRRARRAR